MAFSESFSRSDEIEQARRRRFDTLPLEDRPCTPGMRDPQQLTTPPRDEMTLVLAGSERVQVMVEPVVLEGLKRSGDARRASAGATTSRHAGDGGPSTHEPMPDPRELARQVVAEARETARMMLQQAREVITADRAAAVRDGYEQGLAQGRAEADAEAAGLLRTCEQIGVHVAQERERVLDASEADIVELAISIANRIVGASLDVDETLVVESCRSAMRKAFQRGSMQVLANPEDLELLRSAGPKLAEELGGVDHLDFIAERRLDRGSVVVRTPAGEIDGTIEGKSSKIELTLREGIEQRRAERRAAGERAA